MTRWRLKRCPLLTAGRASHAVVGAGLVLAGDLLAGQAGAAGAVVVAAAAGYAWELATPELARRFRWAHPFGDLVDLGAFAFGAAVGAVAAAVFSRN